MFVTLEGVRDALKEKGVLISNSHVVLTSGRHSGSYFDKNALTRDPQLMASIGIHSRAKLSIEGLCDGSIKVLAAPAVAGIPFVQVIGQEFPGEVLVVFTEHVEASIMRPGAQEMKLTFTTPGAATSDLFLAIDEELLVRRPAMVLKRGHDKVVEGKRVLLIEDVITTGATSRASIDGIRAAGGIVEDVFAVCNRSNITAAELGVKRLMSLFDLSLESWSEEECELCKKGIPINTTVGHGQAFLDRKKPT